MPAVERLTYGADPSQWVDLHEPSGETRGLVVLIHGGFWKQRYDASYCRPLALDLVALGWTVALVEYRRVGGGGGWPETFDDVDAAINAAVSTSLDQPEALDQRATVGRAQSRPVIAVGHSAGGHLATWAAARTRFDRWAGGVEITHVLSLAGVLDLTSAHEQHLGGGAVEAFMGVDPSHAAYDLADPMRHLPLTATVWAIHARDDEDVPFAQSERYVAASDTATLVEVPGGHFGLVDPNHEAWRTVAGLLESLG